MSSHREAPESSKDPAADSTDLYAFVDYNDPTLVTMIANYIPFESPDGGPNFYEFADDVQYDINIDNDGDGLANITYRFKFKTVDGPNASTYFLYNVGPMTTLPSPNWSRPQTFTLTRIEYVKGHAPTSTVLGTNFLVPPCNIGPLSTPNYATNLQAPAIQTLSRGGKVFAGQRAEGFYVDLGAVFDLGNLRPFQNAHAASTPALPFTSAAMGINSTDRVNVHSLALQIPITQLTSTGTKPANTTDAGAVIGVWTTASRQKVRIYGGANGETVSSGPYVQVSRLGNPLINELVIPLALKDKFNSQPPVNDSQFATYGLNPELALLLPGLYPGAFPNLEAYNTAHAKPNNNRLDLALILFEGIPATAISAVPTYTTKPKGSTVIADMLRLNVVIPPTAPGSANNLGLLGGDVAGFPNGRRVFDDVATIELRAVAGATLGLTQTNPQFTPDALAGAPFATSGYVNFGLTNSQTDLAASGQGASAVATEHYLPGFPYLGVPHSGYDANTPVAATGGNDLAGAATGPLPASGA
jgi:Domain of unknown function (DUF4331)